MRAKIECFLWGSYESGSNVPLHESCFISANTLKRLRLLQLLLHSLLPIYYIYTLRVLVMIKYLTVIGMYATLLYFILITMASYFPLSPQSTSLRRCIIVIFEVTFSVQFTITCFFWVCLYPVYDKAVLFPNWTAFLIVGLYMHSGCLLGLWIDNLFNRIKFAGRHFIFLLGVMLLYGAFSFSYKQIYGSDLYPVVKWDHGSLGYILLALGMSVGHFYLGMWFSEYKIRKGLRIHHE